MAVEELVKDSPDAATITRHLEFLKNENITVPMSLKTRTM